MEFVEYMKIKKRMTTTDEDGYCGINCFSCKLAGRNNGHNLDCVNFEIEYPEEAEAIVKKWAEGHPQKTIFQDLLEKHPNVRMRTVGVPSGICPYNLGYFVEERCCEFHDCEECWSQPLEN